MSLGLPTRIESKISPEPNTGCWLWTAYTNRGGYGGLRWKDRYYLAHRAVYELLVCKPTGDLDHLCRVRCCVNPQHLEEVTNHENILRGESLFAKQARQTHCIRGHLLSGFNCILEKGKFGPKRRCRTCHYNRMNTAKQKAKQ